MKKYCIILVILTGIFALSSCSKQKEWEEAVKEWQEAVKERDQMIAKLQEQQQVLQTEITKCQKTVASLQEATPKMNLNEELKGFRENEREFLILLAKIGIPETQRKHIFIDLLNADDKALLESTGNIEKHDTLLVKYESEVIKKYNLTQEQVEFIKTEGFIKQWLDRMGL